MAAELRFPLYSLSDMETEKAVFKDAENERRLLLFTSAEKASRYRTARGSSASVVKLKEPSDLRLLLASQGDEPEFSVEIDADR